MSKFNQRIEVKVQVKNRKAKRKQYNERDTKSLLHACGKGDLSRVKQLLSEGVDPDAHDRTHGFRPLHTAAYRNHIPVARALLNAGADINARIGYGGTDRPLEIAAERGHMAMVKFLIAQGAEINRNGVCPVLTKAVEKANHPLIELLLGKNAGSEPGLLRAAIRFGDPELAARIIKRGMKGVGDPEAEKGLVWSAAAYRKGDGMIRLIARYGADLFSPLNWQKETPLHVAGHDATALFLIENGADIHALTIGGYSPLHTCAEKGFVQARKRLLKLGIDPRLKARNGDTPRVCAKLGGHQATYDLLTEALKQASPVKSATQHKPAGKTKPRNGPTKQASTPRIQIQKPTWKFPQRCASAFMELAREGYPEFAVFAVKASFAAVLEKGNAFWPKSCWRQNVEIKSPETSDAGFSKVSLIEIRGNPWTMVLVSMWANDLTRMVKWATTLSKDLRTTTVAWCDGEGGYQLSVHWLGELQECITWCGGEVGHFKSKFRKRPKLSEKDEQIADQLIGEHGIYFAPCYPCELGTKKLALAVFPEAKGLIARADLLES